MTIGRIGWRKRLLLFAVLVLGLCLLQPVSAARAERYGAYTCTGRSSSTVWITGYYGNAADLRIPDTLGGKRVVGIDRGAFRNKTNLREVLIPDSVTHIGQEAFADCVNLEKAALPGALKVIGKEAFSGCRKLKSVTIPAGVGCVGEGAFSGCTALSGVTLAGGVTAIGKSAFRNCTALRRISIPQTVTEIRDGAFSGCTSLNTVIMNGCSPVIGDGAFDGCPGMREEKPVSGPVRNVPACVSDTADIRRTRVTLKAGETVRIVTGELFSAYPEHSGLYGAVCSEREITLTPEGGSGRTVRGKGVVEFSFDGATALLLRGSGEVTLLAVPVPCLKVDTQKSLVRQRYDTRFITHSARGNERSRMFILAAPHVYVYAWSGDGNQSVMKRHTLLAPAAGQYAYLDGLFEEEQFSFISDLPVLVQCYAREDSMYSRANYYARPMRKVAGGFGYEAWAYADLKPADPGCWQRIDETFDVCFRVAREEMLSPECPQMEPILMALLNEEITDQNMGGWASNPIRTDRPGYRNFIYVASYGGDTDWITSTVAHEVGHIVQRASFVMFNNSWFWEGFANYFCGRVMQRMGLRTDSYRGIDPADRDLLKNFRNGPGAIAHIRPKDRYRFGEGYMRYLEATYGPGFYRRLSEAFWRDLYKGREKDIVSLESRYTNDEAGTLERIRSVLGDDAFRGFHDYIIQERYRAGR